MKIFDKRPLSLILCILLGAFVFFTYGDKTVRIALISVAILLILISIFLRNLLRAQRFTLILASLLIIFSTAASYAYFDTWYYAEKRFLEESSIEGIVESINFDGSVKNMVVSTYTINDAPLSSYKIIVNIGNNDTTNITPGAKVRFVANLKNFDSTSDFDSASYYYSRGYSAEAGEVKDLEVIGSEELSFIHEITSYREALARRLVLYSDKSSGGLLAALLLGERSFLDGEIKLDFSRIGITHILALSGMHVAILCYGFSRLLSLFHVNKKWRKASEIFFAAGYMALTGFPISVVRAGLMLIISSLLFLLSSTRDAVTNLFISVTLIVIAMPYSVFDISLWLSAFATLGIIVFSQINEKLKSSPEGFTKRAFVSFFSPFLSSFFALNATLLISLVSFGSLSSVSIISTAIFSPIFLVLMYLGTFFLITASFIPLGSFVTLYCGFVASLSAKLSSFKYALLSTNFILTELLIVLSTLFFFFLLILNIKRKRLALVLSISLFLSTFISAGLFTSAELNKFEFEYNETDERERILMKSDANTALIEISRVTNSVIYQTIAYLEDNNALYLDDYFITDYSYETCSALENMLSAIKVKTIYLPAPKSETHKLCFLDVLEVLDNYSVNVVTYQSEEPLRFSDFTLFPIYSDERGRCAFTILYQDEFYTYMTADMFAASTKNYALKIMNGANTVIIGAKNESFISADFIHKLDKNTKLIYNKKSGLPDEILTYYENRITVDPNGTIDLYVE